MPYSAAHGRVDWIRKLGIALLAIWALAGTPAIAAAAPADTGVASKPGGQASGADAAAIAAFQTAAESMYDAVRQGNRLQTTRALNDLELRFRKLPMTAIARAEGVQALASGVAELKRALASVTPDERRIEQAAGAVRLAADALANPGKPMWLQYRVVLKEDIDELDKALAASPTAVSAEGKKSFGELSDHYQLIRTAASLRGEPYAIERADSVMRYAERVLGADKLQPELLQDLTANLRGAMNGLFPAAGQQPATAVPVMPSSWGFAATIGSFIVTILSWAGWRRYKYDRNHPPAIKPGKNGRGPGANGGA